MCHRCKTKPVYEFTNQRKLCKNCYINWFQKKFLFTIRKFGMIKRGDIVNVRGNDYRAVVLKYLFEILEEKGVVEIKNKGNKIAITSTLDSEANEMVETLIKGKEKDLKNLKPVEGKVIKPLYLFLDEEVLLYAKLKKLKFKKEKGKKTKISEFIDELEQKHPEVKRAVVNSYLKLYKD